MATQLKKAIERDADNKPIGWRVTLMSQGQGNIGSNTEYNFMMELMSNDNKALPDYLSTVPIALI